ncbi:MAG: hypothetical protein BroJett013_25920 [Alphaproteobacteria bacterium]|nr:MAG: hypothetical protein BroJett013_25920 [Alphaproteobacteria bacterium]
MQKRTTLVEGPLAFKMRRAEAARAGAFDLEIMMVPQLAARLAGGFIRPALTQDIDDALGAVLDPATLGELAPIANLPGMVRAMRATLTGLWRADPDVLAAETGERFQILADVDRRVRAALPTGVMAPPDLAAAALKRADHASAVLGDIEICGISDIAAVWRSLLNTLAARTSVTWRNPGTLNTAWFAGAIVTDDRAQAAQPSVVSCADPRAEVVETLRWMRSLIAEGQAQPHDIAITAPSPELWDEHFLALAGEADLPLHFSHGVPALSTPAGQLCAALADILLYGLSQDRFRRLTGFGTLVRGPLRSLPPTWSVGLSSGAGLFEVGHWKAALDAAALEPSADPDPRPILMPLLDLLAKGANAAAEAGEQVLGPTARELWREALRRAPAEAIEYTLQTLRTPDPRDPTASVVWAPTAHLVGAPRPWLRCLGLNTRSWPRQAAEDPLLPERLMPRARLQELSVSEEDRRAYALLLSHAHQGVVLSRARRNAQGGRLSPSPLLPGDVEEIGLARTRTAEHAFSHADRLLARPSEARTAPHVARPTQLWRNWRFNPSATEHDGLMRAEHPMLARALGVAHSATSLRQLLRDPASFVWQYALGWRVPTEPEAPLELDAGAYGELVHAVLRRAVETLEPNPGYMSASDEAIEAAVKSALIAVADQWRVERSIPPRLLWRNTIYRAGGDALTVLKYDRGKHLSATSWAEVRFGEAQETEQTRPWAATARPTILDGAVALRGIIDRLDLAEDQSALVTDYKTGAPPENRGVIAGGADLQRAVYAAAVRAILTSTGHVGARLLFVTKDGVEAEELENAETAIKTLERSVAAARAALIRGVALPGPDARETWNEYRLALPATLGTYLDRKNDAFGQAFGDLTAVWQEP